MILKYPGSKRKEAPRIARLFEQSGAKYYYEPFFGSGAAFFEIMSKLVQDPPDYSDRTFYLSDVGHFTTTFHLAVLGRHEKMLDWFEKFVRDAWTEEKYNEIRDAYNAAPRSNLTALGATILYLNQACFNGIVRHSKRSGFNVPWGQRSPPNIKELRKRIERTKSLLKGDELNYVLFQKRDFRDALEGASKKAFIYLDPPYQTAFTAYSGGWRTEDFEAVCEIMKRYPKAVLSHKDIPALRERLSESEFIYEPVTARTSCSGEAKGRGTRQDVLIHRITDA